MKHFAPVSRRNFLNLGLIGGTALLAGPLPVAAASRSRGSGSPALKLGVASYTFRKFTLDQTLEMTRKAGLKYITLKDMHLPMKTTAAERAAVREKVQAAGITLMGGGVIYLNNDEQQLRDSFVYVKE
ncbi:MAG TPA: sugar phosphate isomerase/epimerase, partial [Candidatus Paceibacterota bacterium]|nr:sugar phosphate isomerase/epimerase [Candidatus Paceibacterota bacterium]